MQTCNEGFIFSQFGYCPLVRMLHSRRLNHPINNTHDRDLETVYRDYNKYFIELLNLDKSVPIHDKNFQILLMNNIFSL